MGLARPPYGEGILHTLSCVSLRGTKETGIKAGRFHLSLAIYAVFRSFSRPIVGHTPRKLPAFAAISRIIADCALAGALISYNNTPVCVKDFFKKISPLSHNPSFRKLGVQSLVDRGKGNHKTFAGGGVEGQQSSPTFIQYIPQRPRLRRLCSKAPVFPAAFFPRKCPQPVPPALSGDRAVISRAGRGQKYPPSVPGTGDMLF